MELLKDNHQARIIILVWLSVFLNAYSLSAENLKETLPLQIQYQDAIFFVGRGKGVSLGYHLNPRIYLGVESFASEGTFVERYEDEKTSLAFSRFYPISREGVFYLQLGIADFKRISEQREYLFPIEDFHSRSESQGKGTNVGFGWNFIFESGFSFGIGSSSIYGYRVKKKTTITGKGTEEDLARGQQHVEDRRGRRFEDSRTFLYLGWNFKSHFF